VGGGHVYIGAGAHGGRDVRLKVTGRPWDRDGVTWLDAGIALLCFAYLEELNKQSGAELSSKGDLPNIWHTDIECVKWGTYVLLHNM
jgi:hypothetical protein